MNLQKKETLLIVDDSKFQRAIIKEMLGEHFRLEEATSGEECLMILEKSSHLIDLVLLDLVMPGIDGFEVLRRRQTLVLDLLFPILKIRLTLPSLAKQIRHYMFRKSPAKDVTVSMVLTWKRLPAQTKFSSGQAPEMF